jgi:hypothetical protein
MTMSHRKPGFHLTGRGPQAGRIENPARNTTDLIKTFALLLALMVAVLPFATAALGDLPAADKAAFYRMRKQAIQKSLQNWRQSTMPGAAKEISRLTKEEREIDAKLTPTQPRPPARTCGGCPSIDPDWCGLNCTGR